MATNNKKESKFFRNVIIGFGAVFVIVAFVAAGLIAPMTTTDGTEKFTGVELEVAKHTLAFIKDNNDSPLSSFPLFKTTAHIEKIEPTKKEGNPAYCTDDPNDIGYYTITVHNVGWYGATGIIRYDGCLTRDFLP